MSNQGQAPAAPVAPEEPKPKQFLVMVDEIGAALIGRICPGLQFVEVQGIHMKDNEMHLALVTPVIKAVPAAAPVEDAPKVD